MKGRSSATSRRGFSATTPPHRSAMARSRRCSWSHGGGDAFEPWAKLWADRGYVALAMDLSGRGPDRKRLLDGGPDQDDETKFRDFDPADPSSMWTYQAVAAVLRGHSLLASRSEVDANRIGVTGISWGGYLTCIVAGGRRPDQGRRAGLRLRLPPRKQRLVRL